MWRGSAWDRRLGGRAAVLVGRQAINDLEERWADELGAERMERMRLLLEDLVEVVRASDRAVPYPEGHD